MLVTLRSPTHPYHSLYFLQSSLEESVGKSTGEAFTLQGTPTTFQPSREKIKSDQAKDQSPLWLLDNSLQKERKKKKIYLRISFPEEPGEPTTDMFDFVLSTRSIQTASSVLQNIGRTVTQKTDSAFEKLTVYSRRHWIPLENGYKIHRKKKKNRAN
jgi:hypothetical protein